MEIDGGKIILNLQLVGRISNRKCNMYDRAPMCFIDLASDCQRKGILPRKSALAAYVNLGPCSTTWPDCGEETSFNPSMVTLPKRTPRLQVRPLAISIDQLTVSYSDYRWTIDDTVLRRCCSPAEQQEDKHNQKGIDTKNWAIDHSNGELLTVCAQGARNEVSLMSACGTKRTLSPARCDVRYSSRAGMPGIIGNLKSGITAIISLCCRQDACPKMAT